MNRTPRDNPEHPTKLIRAQLLQLARALRLLRHDTLHAPALHAIKHKRDSLPVTILRKLDQLRDQRVPFLRRGDPQSLVQAQ